MDFEEKLQDNLFKQNVEKTTIDKLLGKDEADKLKQLVKKTPLDREDISEILYHLGGVEMKLYNLGSYERYVVLKLFVWLREFAKLLEVNFDVREKLEESGNLSARGKVLLLNNKNLMEHNLKFLVDLFLSICRSSLSLGGTGFLELLKNKFEMSYPDGMPNANYGAISNENTNKKMGLFSR